ncbi:MAG: 3'(2'),5'-bisphosphate nucleotidase [Chloroflexota bacterium]|nr:3'(2'),5'-bisphosphate nucleotidase [Chloroflexota bacterium]
MSDNVRVVGIEAVRAAARLCEAVRVGMVRGEMAEKLDKADRSPVTVADFGAQALVCRRIWESFPEDAIVAEEDSAVLRRPESAGQLAEVTRYVCEQVGETPSETVCEWIDRGNSLPEGRYWVLDPIDGTKGFLRDDQYAIALALIEEGAIQWGFLGCPKLPHDRHLGVLFVAQRGEGTVAYLLEGEPLGAVRVSELRDPSQVCLAESVESGHTNRSLSVQLKEMLDIRTESLRMDSQAKYAAVARGEAEIYLRAPNPRTPDYRENIWDHAAGWLVVKEAGGEVSDVYGRPLDWSRGRRLEENLGVVATNGRVHEAVIEALATLLQ